MRWFCILALLAACKATTPEATVDAKSVHPDLVCPDGTIGAGKGPPLGFEVWCHKSTPSGTWLRHGPSIAWHPNEQRSSVGSYQEGKRSGPWEFYYATGQLEKQGTFVTGVENGVWTAFHPSGARMSEGEMVDGKAHGPWSYWQEDGSSTTGTWVLGERDGVWLEHDKDGEATSERVYKAGRMTSMREL